jgi:hypothetical protein
LEEEIMAGRTLAPEGHYFGSIIKQDIYSTKDEGGTPYLGFTVLLKARDDDFGKKQDLEVPITRMFNLWLNSSENVKRTAASLRYLGYDDPDIRKINPWHDEHISLVGKEVALDITHKPDQKDELQESIWLSKAKKALTPEASKETLDKVADLFKAYQDDYKEKKVSKLSDDEVERELEKAQERVKKQEEGENFNPAELEGAATY